MSRDNSKVPFPRGIPIVKTASPEPAPGLPGMINPANRTAAKVIYIITVEDPSSKSGFQNYVCLKQGLREGATRVEITGSTATSAKITSDKAEKLLDDSKSQANIIVPWHRVISIKNLTYSKAQKGE